MGGCVLSKITSREIARLAGVSVSTVSIVLNNKPGVGDETRERVLKILADNSILPKTASDPSKGIIRFCKIAKHGRIINDRHNVFISEYIDGVVEESKRFNFSVEFSTYNMVPISSIVSDLQSARDLAGCIILSTELSEDEIALFSALRVPHVFLDAMYKFFPGKFITMDNYGMVYEAIRYLKECGHVSIGMLASEGGSNFSCRREAFEDSIVALGLTFDSRLIYTLRSTHLGSYDDMKAILEGGNIRLPTAFFACNDMVAIGAMRAMQEAGIRVPEQVSIVGFDDLPSSSLIAPALTSLSVPKTVIGRYSVQLLLDESGIGGSLSSEKYMIGGSLVQRASVSHHPISD